MYVPLCLSLLSVCVRVFDLFVYVCGMDSVSQIRDLVIGWEKAVRSEPSQARCYMGIVSDCKISWWRTLKWCDHILQNKNSNINTKTNKVGIAL